MVKDGGIIWNILASEELMMSLVMVLRIMVEKSPTKKMTRVMVRQPPMKVR